MTARSKAQIAGAAPARTKASQASQQAEERYRNIFENAVEGIIQSTPGGRFLSLNPAMARIYGYDSPQEMIESVTDIARQLYADPKARLEFTRRIKIDGKVEKFEACNLRKDGSLIWTSTNARTVRDAWGRVLYYEGFVQDITERKRAEEEVRKRNEELALLNAINVAANHGESLTAVINLISEKVIGLFGSLGATLHLFNAERSRLVMHNMPLPPKLAAQVEKLIGISIPLIELDPRQAYPFRQVLESKQACLLSEPAQIHESISAYIDSSPFSEKVRTRLRKLVPGLTKLLGERSQLVVPLISEGEVIGTLDLGSRGMFTEDDLRRLESIAGQLTTVIKRKRAEEAFRKNEQQLSLVFDTVGDVIFLLAVEPADCFRFVAVNPAFLSVTGLSRGQVVGKRIEEVLPETAHALVIGNYKQAIKEKKTVRWEEVSAYPTGTLYGDVAVTPAFDQNGICTHLVGSVHDLTGIRQAEKALEASEKRLQAIVEHSLDEVSLVTADGTLIWESPTAFRPLGYPPGTFDGRSIFDLFHPDDRVTALQTFSEVVQQSGSSREALFRLRHQDGTWRWMEGIAINLLQDPAVGAVVINYHDITERKQAEQALLESEEKHRTLFETMTQGVVYQVADGKIISANPAAERILGLTLDQMQVRTSTDPRWKAIHEDGSDFPGDTHPSMVALTTGKDVHDVVMGVFNPELEDYRWININAIPQFRQGETVPHQVYTTFNDITERKRVEEVLRESEAKLKAVFETLPVGISILDAERKISYMNSALERILDISRDSLFKGDYEGRTYLRPDGTPMPAEEYASVRALKEQRAVHNVETGVVKEDGNVIWVSVSAVPVTFPDWKVVVVTSDITERKQAETALIESETRYRSLFESMLEGYAFCRMIFEAGRPQDFIYLAVNNAFGKLTGLENVVGKKVTEVIPGIRESNPELLEIYGRVSQTGIPEKFETYLKALEIWLSISAFSFNQGDFIAVFDNITERKQAEEKNSRQMTNLQTLYEGARNLAESLDLSSLSEGVTRTCVDVFGIRLAWIGFAEPDGSVSVMNHYPAHIQYPHTIEERWDDAPRGHGPTGRAIRSALPQVITDINQAPEYIPWRIAALREGFCTSAAFPLISRDMAFGVLNLYSDQPGFFTPERVEFFQAYANQAAAALEKGRLFADLQSAHTRLRELSTRLVEIEEEQRHEIARELHDSVGQSLTALNINLSIIQDQFAGQASASTSVRLADSVKLVEQAVERIRDVMAELRPPVLDDYGLLPALRWYAEQYTGRTNIRAVVLEPQVAIPRLPPSVETALFRISQETLTNISRHAEASQVSLSLDMVDGSPRLTIQDDGIGFDPSQADTGWGLRIMRERAEAVGGKLVVESSPGKGSKVVVDVPLPQAGGKELPEKQEGI